jgi:hypothetical protein
MARFGVSRSKFLGLGMPRPALVRRRRNDGFTTALTIIINLLLVDRSVAVRLIVRLPSSPEASASPADRSYHLLDLRFFTVDSAIGARQWSFHGTFSAG